MALCKPEKSASVSLIYDTEPEPVELINDTPDCGEPYPNEHYLDNGDGTWWRCDLDDGVMSLHGEMEYIEWICAGR